MPNSLLRTSPELKPEGYVPVSKHSVSPWELVEGAKGGCNVVPWQELGGVRYDKQPHKMEVCVLIRQAAPQNGGILLRQGGFGDGTVFCGFLTTLR